MSPGIDILDGISQRIRDAVGPEASNRGSDSDDAADDTDSSAEEPDSPSEDAGDETGGESVTADDDRATSDYDAPACCSAAGNTDMSVFDS
ncbi:MAG: hypothetical protein ABEH60_07390 [Halonotius sp.]